MSDKEKRGIYNVTFNDKKATPINTDVEIIEDAVINEIIYYIKGWHNVKRNKGRGAEHIKLHLEKGSEGEITLEELLNIGNSLRAYLERFKEPYLEDKDKSGRVFEWQNKEGIRFRVAIDEYKEEGLIPPLSPLAPVIITFYFDRNFNQQMEFKNPKVAQYYKEQETQNKSPQDSAIAKMKQKIDEMAKKGFSFKSDSSKDKGAGR